MVAEKDTPASSRAERKQSGSGISGFEELTAAGLVRRSKWSHLGDMRLLQGAFLAGIVVTMRGDSWSLGQDWRVVFVAMSTLCLGFGAATLVYWVFSANRAIELRLLHRELRDQTDALVRDLDRYENRKLADRS
jgi:hypothetical protein